MTKKRSTRPGIQVTPNARKRTRGVTPSEKKLWDKVAETVEPERRSKSVLLQSVDLSAMQRALGDADDPTISGPSIKPTQFPNSSRTAIASPKPSSKNRRSADTQPLTPDQRTLKKVRSGRKPIEARLDLHGMRQHEAHGALRAFLGRCHARGIKWALVITGTGSRSRLNTDFKTTHSNDWNDGFSERSRPGILKERVPMWLQEPDLRGIVIGFSQAAPHHGGEGALYIHLKSHKRT